MQSHLINNFLNSDLIRAIFLTLMHSLGQGILFALIAGAILLSTKNVNAGLRYKLFVSALLSFLCISTVTFCYELFATTNNHAVVYQSALASVNEVVSINKTPVKFFESVINAFKASENFIVLIWFVVITFKCLQLLSGLRSVYILKHKQVFSAGEFWNDQLRKLATTAGIKKPVTLLKSSIAKVPMVLGHLKPVILFPASALTALTQEEIEAILLHELAHIRRKDYLVNMLQSFVEIIFFFNPAVLWISSLIKEERENCCDDIAIKQVKNKKQFIHALVSFQEYNLDTKFAASFSGKKNYLFNRIKRIITNNNKTLNNMEKIFLVTGIIITGVIAVAFAQHKQSSFAKNNSVITSVINANDTVPKSQQASDITINTTLNGKQYKLVEKDGKTTELYVDGQKIPDEKIADYDSVIDALHEKIVTDKAQQQETMEAQKEAIKAQAKALELKAKEMQDEMKESNHANDSVVLKAQSEALKIQAKELKKQALIIKDKAEKQAAIDAKKYSAQAKAMQKEMMLAMKSKMNLDQQKIQADIIKEKTEAMKDEINGQVQKQLSELQKNVIDQTKQQQINEEIKKQTEKIKIQTDKMMQELNIKIDSIRMQTPQTPAGAK